MGPAALGLEALPGRIARAARKAAGRPFGLPNHQVDRLGAVGVDPPGLLRLHGQAGEQPRRDQRVAQIVGLAAVVQVAALEAREDVEVVETEHRIPGGHQLPEARARTGIDRQRIGAGRLVRLVVEQDVAVADLDEGIALLRQDQADVRLRRLDARGLDRIADLQRQVARDEVGRDDRLGFDLDRRQAIQPPRGRRDGGAQTARRFAVGAGLRLDQRNRGAVIIAERLHQPHRQPLVLARPGRDLGRIRRLALALLQGGQRLELVLQPQFLQAGQHRVVPDFGRVGALDVGGGLQRRRIELRQRDQRLRQFGIFRRGGGQRRIALNGARLSGGLNLRHSRLRGILRHGLKRRVDVAAQRRQCGIECGIGDDRPGVDRGIVRGRRDRLILDLRRIGPLRRRRALLLVELCRCRRRGEQRDGKPIMSSGQYSHALTFPFSRAFAFEYTPKRLDNAEARFWLPGLRFFLSATQTYPAASDYVRTGFAA